jgi:hypothetical protein
MPRIHANVLEPRETEVLKRRDRRVGQQEGAIVALARKIDFRVLRPHQSVQPSVGGQGSAAFSVYRAYAQSRRWLC